MAYTLEISYFNSVILKPASTVTLVNTSASDILAGQPPTINPGTQIGDWHIE